MTLLAFGINHKTAPLAIRERFVLAPSLLPQQLQRLVGMGHAREAVILSTCNRTEFYCHDSDVLRIKQWLLSQHALDSQQIEPCLYSHGQAQAVRHILRVANGLDSMIIGEPQILGQMKEAFAIARETGTVGSQLGHLFQYVFAASKEVRTRTNINAHPISVAYISVTLAKRIFAKLTRTKVLLIGAGETMELTARHLQQAGVQQFYIANRTAERGALLAEQIKGTAIPLSEIPIYLKEVDIVVAATHSTLPILGKGMVEQALKVRKHRPLLMIDLAVPRDIEAQVAELSDVYLYNMDDLQTLAQEGMQHRQLAAQEAEQLIELQVEQYMRQLHALDAVELIRQYREQISLMRDEELDKALHKLQHGADPKEVLKHFAHTLCNKLMHQPSTQLRLASEQGDIELLGQVAYLLGLNHINC